jgi:hypothetical protein
MDNDCFSQRPRWGRRTLAVLPAFRRTPTPGRPPDVLLGVFWSGPGPGYWSVPDGAGSADITRPRGTCGGDPGAWVRVDPCSAVSSTTSNPSPCPPLPQRPRRETPSARTVLRKRRILSRNRRSCLHIPNAVSASALDDSPRFRPGRSARVPPMDHPTYLASRTRARARA